MEAVKRAVKKGERKSQEQKGEKEGVGLSANRKPGNFLEGGHFDTAETLLCLR